MEKAFSTIVIVWFAALSLASQSAATMLKDGSGVYVVDRGPIEFSQSQQRQTLTFNLKAEELEGCKSAYFFLMAKSLVQDKHFVCSMSVNGKEVGGCGGIYGHWFTGGLGKPVSLLKVGQNTIELSADLNYDKQAGYDGVAGGVVIYLSKNQGEDPGLLCYPPGSGPRYGPEEESAPKANFWAVGLVHGHTVGSDGSRTTSQFCALVQKLLYDFAVITDHDEQIDQLVKATGLYYRWKIAPVRVLTGLDNYLDSCKKETRDGYFVAIAGAEVDTPWHVDSKTVSHAHTLCLGGIQKTEALEVAQGREGKQAEVIAAVNELGPSVMAHPTTTSFYSASIRPWEGLHFRYDLSTPSKWAGICGVEWYNTETPAQDDGVCSLYMGMMRQHYPAFPTGGCDTHGWGDKKDNERLKRLTGVFVEKLTQDCIIEGLRKGHVYASRDGVRMVSANPLPGFAPQVVTQAEFECKFEGLPQKLQCMVYRDGDLVKESKQTISPEAPVYRWQDVGAKGVHWYNVMVSPYYLVTAPIVLDIR